MIYATERVIIFQRPSPVICKISVRQCEAVTVGIRSMNCGKIHVDNFYVGENNDKSIQFEDVPEADYTDAQEISFQVKTGGQSGAVLISKTMSGGDITIIADNILALKLTNTDTRIPPGAKSWEMSITNAAGDQITVGQGSLTVQDTGEWD